MPAIPFGTLTADFDEDRRNRIEEKKDTIRDEMCTCGRIMLKGEDSGSRSLDPDCPVHEVDSAWYGSPEQVEHRAQRSQRLRDFYDQSRIARQNP
jgi:hypothetical protein